MIPEALVPFIESGISIGLATRDAQGMPETTRAVGARVHEDRRGVTLYVPAATAAGSLANLLANDRVAVVFSRTTDHRTLQLKGRRVALREAGESDRQRIDSYLPGLAESLLHVGLPPRFTCRLAHWPAWAIELEVEGIFEATPGPGAGAALGRLP